MVDYHFVEGIAKTKNLPVIGKTQHQFGLMICLAKRGGIGVAVHLPEGVTGVAQIKMAVVGKQVFEQQDLDTELKIYFRLAQVAQGLAVGIFIRFSVGMLGKAQWE